MWILCVTCRTLLHPALKIVVNSTRTAVDLAYKTYGSTQNNYLIVLHGLLGSKHNWNSMSGRIAKETNHTVVAMDARNHGQSPHAPTHTYPDLASDVSKAMDKLAIKEATIIGHSMGGRTGMVLALTQPEKVKKLVVVDISPKITSGRRMNDFFPKLIAVMKSVSFNPSANITQARSLARDTLQNSGIDDSFLLLNVGKRHDNTMGWMCNVDVLGEYFETIASFPSEMQGKQYHGPTLFVGGELSDYLPRSHFTDIQKYFPKAKLEYVPNVGHNVHAEDPSKFFEVIQKFLTNN